MFKAEKLEKEIADQLEKLDMNKLAIQAREAKLLHDKIVPLINEVVMSSNGHDNYESAFKAVIDKLRAVHEKVAQEKQEAENRLMMSAGQKELMTQLLPRVAEISEEYRQHREKIKEERVAEIAERIESGDLEPDAPRKIGTRPESIKNIRSAKATLFGGTPQKDQED